MMDAALKYWPICLFALNALMTWAIWSMRKAFATKADLDPIKGQLAQQDKRIGLIERDLEHLPTKDELHNLKLELSEVVGELREVRSDYRHVMERQSRVESVLTRHEQIFSDAARAR